MSNITDYILSKTKRIKPVTEVTPGAENYSMYNSGGVEVETAEALYSLVRLWKPGFIVETGTHKGISSLYMGLALEKNGAGKLRTFEVINSLLAGSKALWAELGVSHRIDGVLQPSLEAYIDTPIDFLFLDSEPQFRFDEFIKFWPLVKPGGLIIIHDLHASLGKHGNVYHGQLDWPYGEWEPKLGSYVKDLQVQLIHCPNPRGMVIFQKTKATDENIRCLAESYNEAQLNG